MARKKLIILSVIVIGIIAALLTFITKKENNAISTKISPAPSPQTITTTLNKIPTLPSQFTWTKLPSSESINNYNQVYITKEPDIFYAPTGVPGEVWIANLEKVRADKFNPFDDLEGYYRLKLEKLGWNYEIKSAGYQLNGMAGDGGLGSTTGYVGSDQGKIRVINVGYAVTFFDEKTLIRDAKYWVFVSNITPLADIVEQVE